MTLCDLINCSTPVFPFLHYLHEFTQTHVHWLSDVIQPSYPLLPPSPFALNLSQYQGLFQWLGSSHQVAKVLELHLQHQYFQWITTNYGKFKRWECQTPLAASGEICMQVKKQQLEPDMNTWCLGLVHWDDPEGSYWEWGSRWGTRVHSWQIHVDVWQNQYNIVK